MRLWHQINDKGQNLWLGSCSNMKMTLLSSLLAEGTSKTKPRSQVRDWLISYCRPPLHSTVRPSILPILNWVRPQISNVHERAKTVWQCSLIEAQMEWQADLIHLNLINSGYPLVGIRSVIRTRNRSLRQKSKSGERKQAWSSGNSAGNSPYLKGPKQWRRNTPSKAESFRNPAIKRSLLQKSHLLKQSLNSGPKAISTCIEKKKMVRNQRSLRLKSWCVNIKSIGAYQLFTVMIKSCSIFETDRRTRKQVLWMNL